MDFEIHNECGHIPAEEFLNGFLETAIRLLAAHLGRLPVGPVHIVLSDRETHEGRFPPKAGEILELEDLSEIPEDEGEAFSQRYAWSWYAHGVTTQVARLQNPPARMSDGDLAIYLDIESIESISAELDVLFEGMLGRVAAHELLARCPRSRHGGRSSHSRMVPRG